MLYKDLKTLEKIKDSNIYEQMKKVQTRIFELIYMLENDQDFNSWEELNRLLEISGGIEV